MRIIQYSNTDGSREGVFFTDDLEMNAEDVLPPNCEVVNDFESDINLPATFPTEYNLERTF